MSGFAGSDGGAPSLAEGMLEDSAIPGGPAKMDFCISEA